MSSWTNATARAPGVLPPGVLRPAATVEHAGLRREYPVHPALAPFVERYWSVRWRCGPGEPPFRSEVLTHPCVNLSVESGDGPRHGVTLPAALVHGVVTRRFVIDLSGWGRVTAAKFRPGGYTAFTGAAVAADTVFPGPAGLLAAEFPAAGLGAARPGAAGLDTAGLGAADIVAAVLAPDGDADRVAVLDGALAARAPEPDPEYLFLLRVVEEMAARRELVRVDQVAVAAEISTRALQRLFRRFVGVGPKWVLARYRLHDAATAIDAGEVDDLAALAADLGWFDQAHFSRDFRAAVGVTPSSYGAATRPP